MSAQQRLDAFIAECAQDEALGGVIAPLARDVHAGGLVTAAAVLSAIPQLLFQPAEQKLELIDALARAYARSQGLQLEVSDVGSAQRA